MSSAFDALIAACLSPILDQQFGELMTIARGANTTAGVVASWTSQGDVIVSPDGAQTLVVDRVWLVKKSLYLIAAVAVEPRTSDRWTDSAGQVWEVLPSIAGPAVVSYAGGLEWEVKTKKVV